MIIRQAELKDLKSILSVYSKAREYMANTGNASQWGNSYPEEDLILDDIKNHQCYVGVCEDEKIHCVFAFIKGEDSTYEKIYDGNWLNDKKYYTIHRIASDGEYHGIFKQCIDYCKSEYNNLKIDTHRNNATMHYVLQKNGFVKCGIIYLENCDERIAYQFYKS